MSSKQKNNRTKNRRMRRKRFLKKQKEIMKRKELMSLSPETVEGSSKLPIKMITDGWDCIDYKEIPSNSYFFNLFRLIGIMT